MAKRVQLSADDTTYYTLPGNSGELRNEAGDLKDTIFGQNFDSGETGLISWSLNSNAIYKGFAGYIVSLKQSGVPITMTAEPAALVSGKTYRITNAVKRVISVLDPVTVLDNAVDHTTDVLSIDYIGGIVTFKSAYTPTGPITITGKYLPLTELAGAKTFTLTQTAATIDMTDIPTARTNGGYKAFTQGLKTCSMDLTGIYKTANGYAAALAARQDIVVEINPDNGGHAVFRGIFKFMSQGQKGDVGALEEETISLKLAVPDNALMLQPAGWYFDGSETLSSAIKVALNSWIAGTNIFARYLPDGVAGFKGGCVVTDISLAGGLEAMNEFTVNVQGSGAPVAYP